MRTAWAVVCLILVIVVAHWMFMSAGPPARGGTVSLSMLLGINLAPALGVGAVSLLLAAAAGRFDVAARVAVALAVLSLLLTLSHVFWGIAEPPTESWRTAPPVSDHFFPPLWAIALGGLFFESLRRRALRRTGGLPEPVIGDAWLLLCVPLAGLVVLLTMMRF